MFATLRTPLYTRTDKERKEPASANIPKAVETHEEKENNEDDNDDDDNDEDSDFSGDPIDGTSPTVIAQISEILNYAYGKTSVPRQIDRVLSFM